MNSDTKLKISSSVKCSSYFIRLKKEAIDKQQEYYKNPKHCIECNSVIPYNKRNNKFCNSICSGGYNTRGRHHSKETKLKISKSNKGQIPWNSNLNSKILKICPICNKSFKTYSNSPGKFCSKKCHIIDQRNGYVFSVDPKTGGYRKGSGRGKSGWYKGYWCDSSYELAYVIFNIDHQIIFQRNNEFFNYQFENQSFKYYPDFVQNNIYIEIKGFLTNKDQAKFQYFPTTKTLKIITGKDIEKYLKYTSTKYGTDFIKLYEGNPHNARNNQCLMCKKPAKNYFCSRKCAGKGSQIFKKVSRPELESGNLLSESQVS